MELVIIEFALGCEFLYPTGSIAVRGLYSNTAYPQSIQPTLTSTVASIKTFSNKPID